MRFNKEQLDLLQGEYGSPLYVFDEVSFRNNYHLLYSAMSAEYDKYRIAYSFKTNYTPYIAAVVKELGGYAEVVSEMEYRLAIKLGFQNSRIIFNGPDKGRAGIEAFENGCCVNADSIAEVKQYCRLSALHPDKLYTFGLRVNIDVGQNFVSRFGIDAAELPLCFNLVEGIPNLRIAGLHCHISRCRGIDAWNKRAEIMIMLARRFFDSPPDYIDLGSGMFGSMAPEFKAQFDCVPSYDEYADTVCRLFSKEYGNLPWESRPFLFTEPGTTLVNRYIDLAARIETIKSIRNSIFAVLNCSVHNLGETCTLKQLPYYIVPCGNERILYKNISFTGYTCLEQDVIMSVDGISVAEGDSVVFENVGGYSNVLKPPFIRPNCAMITVDENGNPIIIKRTETFDDIFRTYSFPGEVNE